jgi:subtilisin family serine protease
VSKQHSFRALSATLCAASLLAVIPMAAPAAAQTADDYIVVLQDNVDADVVAREHSSLYGFRVAYVYHDALSGYAATLDPIAVQRIAADPRLQFISADLKVQAPPTYDTSPDTPTIGPLSTQTAPTGVRRIGASTNGKNQTLANDGTGVGVAVIDTGIQLNHPDLTPVTSGKNCIDAAKTADDDKGHGTHVAGTIAARDNLAGVVGVAPGANLFAVKSLDNLGNGSWSSLICGVDWVTANAASKGIKVANMSLGGPASSTPSNADCTNGNNDAFHKAICKSVKAGITYVVAAGNDAIDAANTVPAAYSEVITVSAWSDTDGKATAAGPIHQCKKPNGEVVSNEPDETWATFTDYGKVVDIAAPGVGIKSTWLASGYASKCGTSMAAPHVTGAAALLLKSNPGWSPAAVKTFLLWTATALADTGKHSENLLNVSTY